MTYLSANRVFHARTKHIEVDYHFVADKLLDIRILSRLKIKWRMALLNHNRFVGLKSSKAISTFSLVAGLCVVTEGGCKRIVLT